MNHAIVVGGVPQILTGRTFTKPDGSWLPMDALDNMSRAAKMAIGVYEVKQERSGTGPVLVSPEPDLAVVADPVNGDYVEATYTFRARDAQELEDEKTGQVNAFNLLAFEWNFDQENRLRAIESAIVQAAPAAATAHGVTAKPQVTKTQVRNALKDHITG